jgi:hypothetical protein
VAQISLEQLQRLMTDEGRRALAAAAETFSSRAAPKSAPAVIARLRREFSQDMVSAALTLNGLRMRARERFSRADAMFFDGPDLLEQATSEAVARHKAVRFEGFDTVVDLCCGAGGDALQIASQAGQVIGVDCRLPPLVSLRANAQAYGFSGRIHPVAANLDQWTPAGDAYHIDPPRRDDAGRRQLRPSDWASWIEQVHHLALKYANLGGKLSPAVPLDGLAWADEVELISENGVLKQAMVWCGALARSRRTATIIRSVSGHTKAIDSLASDAPVGTPVLTCSLRAGRILHEPDAAVVRAGLLGNLAEQLGAGLVDPHLPLLAGEIGPTSSGFARQYEVLEVAAWSIKKIRQLLRHRGWHVTDVKTRAFACQPEEILAGLRSLKADSSAMAVVLWAVRFGRQPMCLLTRRLGRGERQDENPAPDDVTV